MKLLAIIGQEPENNYNDNQISNTLKTTITEGAISLRTFFTPDLSCPF